jgi:hypothetical protein
MGMPSTEGMRRGNEASKRSATAARFDAGPGDAVIIAVNLRAAVS